MSINNVTLVGRLTKDPELRYTQTGIANTTFTVAVDRPFQNANGEREADFIRVVVWRELAETVAEHLKKGRMVGVVGRIQTGSYENDEGRTIWTTDVVADTVRFLDSPKTEEGGNGDGQGHRNNGNSSNGNGNNRNGSQSSSRSRGNGGNGSGSGNRGRNGNGGGSR